MKLKYLIGVSENSSEMRLKYTIISKFCVFVFNTIP